MNPKFELDQIRRYIEFLREHPRQLRDTAESHFFPVLQTIFFREGFEVRRNQEIHGMKFPFLLVDLDLKKPDVVVDFEYQSNAMGSSILPEYTLEWVRNFQSGKTQQTLLILRDVPLNPVHQKILEGTSGGVKFLDFIDLQDYASKAFDAYTSRQNQRAFILVMDLVEKLIEAIATQKITLDKLHWHDVERLFFGLLQGCGYHAHLTPSSKDGGRDVMVCDIRVDDVHWYNIEIKHWANRKVGSAPVLKTLETALREGRHGALLLSTSGISDAAYRVRTEIYQDYLRFADGNKLVASCKHYTQTTTGLWQPHDSLRSFLFSETK